MRVERVDNFLKEYYSLYTDRELVDLLSKSGIVLNIRHIAYRRQKLNLFKELGAHMKREREKRRRSKKMKGTNLGKDNPNWKGGDISYVCLNCGIVFIRMRRGREYKFCSPKCNGIYITNNQEGVKNHMWNGGSSFIPYLKEFNDKLKEEIRNRDNRVCVLCSKSETENRRRLSVHHIDYNKENNSYDNLISLCNRCHNKTNVNREYWIALFR